MTKPLWPPHPYGDKCPIYFLRASLNYLPLFCLCLFFNQNWCYPRKRKMFFSWHNYWRCLLNGRAPDLDLNKIVWFKLHFYHWYRALGLSQSQSHSHFLSHLNWVYRVVQTFIWNERWYMVIVWILWTIRFWYKYKYTIPIQITNYIQKIINWAGTYMLVSMNHGSDIDQSFFDRFYFFLKDSLFVSSMPFFNSAWNLSLKLDVPL